jgi:4-amino-4-deoxy-L-arabinose transferase-like glycosyltransferase
MQSTKRNLKSLEIPLLIFMMAVGIALRLIHIDQPYVDAWNWRQADVAMIAENFYRNGFNLFYPQINWAGEMPGYVGTEFPLLPYLAALLYLVVGVEDWIGRLISVLFFGASVPFFYLLVRRLSSERGAFLAVGIYILVPLLLFASRSFMPDTAALSVSIIGIYAFSRWLDNPASSRSLVAAIVAITLALLIKISYIIIGLPLLYMAWVRFGPRLVRNGTIWIIVGVTLLVPLAWYTHAYSISVTYPPYHFFGEKGIEILTWGKYRKIFELIATSSLTPVVCAVMLAGIFFVSRTQYRWLFHFWLLAILLFIIIAGEGNSRHPWYQLPMVPVSAGLAGIGIDSLFRFASNYIAPRAILWLGCIALFVSLSYFSYNYLSPLYKPWGDPFRKAGIEIERITAPDALIVTADDGDPTALYYSRRNGWHFWTPDEDQDAINALDSLRSRGASHFLLPGYQFWWLDYYTGFQKVLETRFRRVIETKDYIIFDIRPRELLE